MEDLARHAAMEPPGDGDRSLATVLDVGGGPEAEEGRGAEVVSGCLADEEDDVAAALGVVEVALTRGRGDAGGVLDSQWNSSGEMA